MENKTSTNFNSKTNKSLFNNISKKDRSKRIQRNRTKFPDRWINYKAVDKDIPVVRIVAFKTPLSESFFYGLPDDDKSRFEVHTLLNYLSNKGKTLGLVIDLTNTNKYYDSNIWADNSIEYVKICCPGHEINKHENIVDKFIRIVNDFFLRNVINDKLIGVHCTHGLNRTGYLICRYLIKSLGWSSVKAIKEFEKNRGHKIERAAYLKSLRNSELNVLHLKVEQYNSVKIDNGSTIAVIKEN